MVKKQQKNLLILAAVVVIILVFGFIILAYNSAKKEAQVNANINSAVNANKAKTTTPAKTQKSQTPATGATLTYEQALEQYAGRMIQFSSSCYASPGSVTLKNNTSIMLDNRASVKRTITVGSAKYSVNAYGFTIITVSTATFPATLSLNCDSQYNVAQITLLK